MDFFTLSLLIFSIGMVIVATVLGFIINTYSSLCEEYRKLLDNCIIRLAHHVLETSDKTELDGMKGKKDEE